MFFNVKKNVFVQGCKFAIYSAIRDKRKNQMTGVKSHSKNSPYVVVWYLKKDAHICPHPTRRRAGRLQGQTKNPL